jgi:hypothetical protein
MDWLGELGKQTGDALQGLGDAVGGGVKWTENAAKSALPSEVNLSAQTQTTPQPSRRLSLHTNYAPSCFNCPCFCARVTVEEWVVNLAQLLAQVKIGFIKIQVAKEDKDVAEVSVRPQRRMRVLAYVLVLLPRSCRICVLPPPLTHRHLRRREQHHTQAPPRRAAGTLLHMRMNLDTKNTAQVVGLEHATLHHSSPPRNKRARRANREQHIIQGLGERESTRERARAREGTYIDVHVKCICI